MNILKKYGRKLSAFALCLCGLFMSSAASAFDFVEYDPLTGEVTWDVALLVNPIIVGIVAVVTTISVIWVIVVGIKYLKRYMFAR